MKLTNQNVLITGASSGIGAACAKAFAQEGANLILTARRKSKLDNIAAELTKTYNTKVLTLELDVRNFDALKDNLSNLPAPFTQIDVLINNAGKALGAEKIQDGLLENWDEMIDTNVKGLLYVTRIIVPTMIQRRKGHIINIGSIAGHEVYIGGNVYCSTKHAVKAISKGMLLDLNGTGVRVTSIDPGMVETEFSIVRYKGDKDKASAVYSGLQPLVAEDIADVAVFTATRPAHIDIQTVVVTPTAQASASVVSRG